MIEDKLKTTDEKYNEIYSIIGNLRADSTSVKLPITLVEGLLEDHQMMWNIIKKGDFK